MLCMLLTYSVGHPSVLLIVPMTTDERESNLPNIVGTSVGFELGFECISGWLRVTMMCLALDQVFL